MTSLLDDIQKTKPPKVSQVTGAVNGKTLAGLDQLLLVLPKRVPAALWRKVPQGNKVQALMRKRAPGSIPAVQTRLGNKRQTALVAGAADPGKETFELLSLARKLVAAATNEKPGVLGICVLGFDDDVQEELLQHLVAAAMAAAYVMPAFKAKSTPARLRSIRVWRRPKAGSTRNTASKNWRNWAPAHSLL
jgi:hypothetical protein